MSASSSSPADVAAPPVSTPTSAAATDGPSRGRRAARGISSFASRFGVLVAFGALWEVATLLADSPFFPRMTEILTRTYDNYLSAGPSQLFLTEAVYDDIVPSLVRLLIGWALGTVIAVILGVAIGLVGWFTDFADPVLQFLRSVPPPAIIPLFLIIFGIGDTMKVALITTAVMWPILLNVVDGVRTVPSLQIDTGRIYGIGPWDRLFRIILPTAAPKIFAGMRVGLSIAVIVMVLSEMMAATNGIGFSILLSQRTFQIEDMWAGIVVLGVLGYLLNTALLVVETRVIAWHAASKRRS
jgi:ABC-type nitrate/sulfonate/bicarbonate transport system permease component